ncbi:conserved exported hypothetical protein [Desulfosarcina cetonica]|uniref:transporter n=1 Tax=Desulfosarcina cetonica TaxID=90730 RepID=UPI0006D21BC7|nr:transporter [Desulfosarcina cetonica]VTR67483.1 conserved exported hypothetical protein [Desulfosarcina cetonica]
MKIKPIIISILFVIPLLLPLSALAENDPRDSIAAPDGTSIFLFYYRQYSGEELYAGGDKINSNIDYSLNMAIFRYAHFVGLGDWTWSYDVVQPVGDLDFEGNSSSGLGDTTIATHINTPFFFQSDDLSYMMSAGFYLSAPTGDYHSDKVVNIGCNRWTYKLEYTPVILQTKAITLEFTGDVTFYTDNDDYGASSADLETDPLFSLQTHLTYNVTDAFWIGASHYYYSGAENEIDGISQNDEADNQALRFTASFNVASNVILMLQYNTEIERDNGVKQNWFGTRIAYVW